MVICMGLMVYKLPVYETRAITGVDAPYRQYTMRNLTWLGHEYLDKMRE